MRLLQEKIEKEGKYLGNGILKVDSFMNHQIDPVLMSSIGEEFARRFSSLNPTRILTAESSGIAPALATAMLLKVPLVFARKKKPITMAQRDFRESAKSHTKGGVVDLVVSSEYLSESDRVIILDDFLSTANTINALVRLVNSSGAQLLAIGAVIEKSFEGGRSALEKIDVPVESLAIIESLEEEKVIFAN